jgi:cyclophilin family peptidyl-prolyl cis-trans isomerase
MRAVLLPLLTLAIGATLSAQGAKPVAPKAAPAAAPKPAAQTTAKAGPIMRMETAKGPIVIELYPASAPKSVEHIVELVKRNFYNNQAVHRVVAGQLVQFGDPQTRNMMLVDWWGRGPNSGSGQSIGVAEISKTLKHKRGTVSMANPGNAAAADSQMFIAFRAVPKWDGQYTIIGQVTSGIEVAERLARGDKIKTVTVTAAP